MKEITLSQNKIAIVDDEYYKELAKFKWFAYKHRNTFYAARNIRIHKGYGGQRLLRMHNVILGNIPELLQCDHIDGNGLNNQKANLRIVTVRQNCQNLHIPKTSKFPGVSYVKGRKKPWVAHIWFGSKIQKTLGYFHTEEEAYQKYCSAVLLNDR